MQIDKRQDELLEQKRADDAALAAMENKLSLARADRARLQANRDALFLQSQREEHGALVGRLPRDSVASLMEESGHVVRGTQALRSVPPRVPSLRDYYVY